MYQNGTRATLLPPVRWKKSSYSSPNGNCVELAPLPDGTVAMRNSRDPQGVALVFTRPEFEAFVQGAIAGEFTQFQ